MTLIDSSVIILAALLYLSAPWVTLNSAEDDKSYVKILCALNVSTHSFFGKTGLQGKQGQKGDKGDIGLTGPPGRNCHDGVDGRDGAPGIDGIPGEKGDRGPRGPPGSDGKDAVGPQGEKGRIGEPGTPGIPGSCGCLRDAMLLESDAVMRDHTPGWATKDYKPGNVTCRNAPTSKETGVHYLYLGPMKINCDDSKTCINHSSRKKIEYKQSEPFWLSQRGVSLEDIYNLKSDQLSWLQSESHTATLTIRYHCLNSVPYKKESADRSLMLLSWNDMLIDHDPTTSTPFHYRVPEKTDGCLNASKTVWSSTDIILDYTIAQRLPIIDFYIRDVRNETQSLYIEIVQLCFD